MDLLVDVAREDGVTVVLVTHDPRVAGYADRRVLLTGGQVMPGRVPGLGPRRGLIRT